MTITSHFYTGSVDNLEWAAGTRMLGYRYAVGGPSHFLVTKNASAVRGVQLATGDAFGGGIWDESNAVEPLELPYNAANRWHLVGLNRAWGATDETTVDYITGTATQQIPTRPNEPSVEDFHPLALCFVAGDSAEVSQIIDLRVFADNSGVLFATSDLVRSFIDGVGTRIRIADSTGWVQEWTRILVSTSPTWVSSDTAWDRVDYTDPETMGADTILTQADRWPPQASCRIGRDGYWRNAHLVFDRTTATFQFADGAGRLNEPFLIGTLHAHDKPKSRVSCNANIYTTAGYLFSCTVSIDVDGKILLTAGPPNGTVGPDGIADTLTIDATYLRA